MKKFFLALFGMISETARRFWGRIQSGEFRQMAGEAVGRLKGVFAGDDEYHGGLRKRLLWFAGAAGLVLGIVCVRALIPDKQDTAKHKELVVPKARDANGDVWTLQLMKGESRWIADDRESGPPLLVRTEAQAQSGVITVGVHLEGQAGERYVPGALKNGVWQPAPRFKVVGEDGRVLAEGQFEYG